MERETFYSRAFWLVAAAAVTGCGSLIVIGVRTSNAQAATNATLLARMDGVNAQLIDAAEGMKELRNEVEAANSKALSLFFEANARVNVLAESVAQLRVDLAQAGVSMEDRQ